MGGLEPLRPPLATLLDVDCEESLPKEPVADKCIMLSFETISNSNLLLVDGDSNDSALRLNRMSPNKLNYS